MFDVAAAVAAQTWGSRNRRDCAYTRPRRRHYGARRRQEHPGEKKKRSYHPVRKKSSLQNVRYTVRPFFPTLRKEFGEAPLCRGVAWLRKCLATGDAMRLASLENAFSKMSSSPGFFRVYIFSGIFFSYLA